MSSYWVAAEGRSRTPSSYVTGPIVGPAGMLHAVDAENHVLCGARLRTLAEFRDLSWDGLGKGVVRCRECVEAARP